LEQVVGYFMKNFLGITLVFFFSGCVSVNVGPKKASKAEGVRFETPASPFAALNSEGADKAWLNKTNGNTIAYQSTCNDANDPPLDAIQSEILSVFGNVKIEKTATTEFNGREALRTEAEGVVDGVKTRTELLIFKKNDCTYTLSYVGVAKRFAEDQARFAQFVQSFGAP
jgi:hypothetical protein